MSLSPGVATSGITGAFAIESTDSGGTVRYIPTARIGRQINRGDQTIGLVNNCGYSANRVKGTASADITFDTYLFAGLQNADFFTRAVGKTSVDEGASGYNTVSIWSNNEGGEGVTTYALAKFASLAGSVQFSQNGGAQAMRLSGRLVSADPESATVTALAAPPTGALATSGILGFAQASFTGATNVVACSFNLDTGLVMIPGAVAGSNSEYPSLAVGTLQTGFGGSVTITSLGNPTTFLGGTTGTTATLVMSLGTTGAGVAFQFEVAPMSISKPIQVGLNFWSQTVQLLSIDGVTCPFTVTNL